MTNQHTQMAKTANFTIENSTHPEIGFYADLSKAENCEELKSLILEKVNHLGFFHFSFVRLSYSNGDPGLLSTIPKELTQSYYNEALFKHDMLLSYASLNTAPIYRSYIDRHAFLNMPIRTEASIANENIFQLNKSYGLYDYYCVFSKSHNGLGKAMLSVSIEGMNPIDFHKKVSGSETTLQLLCEAIDYVAIRKFPEYFLSPKEDCNVKINSRPLQVLNTLANSDMTVKQVASALSISIDTVNQHLITAKKALGTHTNIGAIKKAVLMGLIDYKK